MNIKPSRYQYQKRWCKTCRHLPKCKRSKAVTTKVNLALGVGCDKFCRRKEQE